MKAVSRCRKWTGKNDLKREQERTRGYPCPLSLPPCGVMWCDPLCVGRLAVSFGSGVVTGVFLGVAIYMAINLTK